MSYELHALMVRLLFFVNAINLEVSFGFTILFLFGLNYPLFSLIFDANIDHESTKSNRKICNAKPKVKP